MSIFTKEEDLFPSVLLNGLILENIFSNLEVKSAIPFRLVCHTWKLITDKKISAEFCANFRIRDEESDIIHHIPKGFFTFNLLKLSRMKIKLRDAPVDTPGLYQLLRACSFSQIKYVFLDGAMSSKYNSNDGWSWVKKLLILAPNLENLKVPFSVNSPKYCEAFQDVVHHNLRSFRMIQSHISTFKGSRELFVDTVVKNFPNLDENFGIEEIDYLLLTKIVAKETPETLRLKTFSTTGFRNSYQGKEIKLLDQLDTKMHQISKMEFVGLHRLNQNKANRLSKVIQRFANSLKEVKLIVETGAKVEMKLPKLPNLRKLSLGTEFLTSLDITWNTGDRMAEQFPLLEYFDFLPGRCKFEYDEQPEYFSSICIKSFWPLWSSFVPFGAEFGEKEVGNSDRLRFLKFVDLTIPKGWIGPRKNRNWGKMFLKNYSKLYGNAGNGRLIEEMTKWLQ